MALNLPKSEYYEERKFPNWRNRFTINWLIDYRCNFNCVYCIKPESLFKGYDVDVIASKFKEIADKQPLRVVITGGEPLIMPNFIELIQKIGKFSIIEVQTNFTVNAREFVDNVDPKTIERIYTTFHPSQRKEPYTTEKYISDVLYARSKGFTVDVYFVDYPAMTTEEYLGYCKILYDAGITPQRKRYCGHHNGIGYSGDALDLKGRKCNSGYKAFFLWEDLSITVGDTCRIPLGNLLTGYKLYDAPFVCTSQFCGCLGRELVLDKYYDEFYQREYGDGVS